MRNLILRLCSKDGELSKTAVMLWLAFFFVSFKYLCNGLTIHGHLIVFEEWEAVAYMGIASGSYLGSNRVWRKDPRISSAKAKAMQDQANAESQRAAASQAKADAIGGLAEVLKRTNHPLAQVAGAALELAPPAAPQDPPPAPATTNADPTEAPATEEGDETPEGEDRA